MELGEGFFVNVEFELVVTTRALEHLVKVVIFGGVPKNGNGGNIFGLKPLADGDGAQGFVEHEGGTTEQAGLLARDHGHRLPLFEAFEILQCCGSVAR